MAYTTFTKYNYLDEEDKKKKQPTETVKNVVKETPVEYKTFKALGEQADKFVEPPKPKPAPVKQEAPKPTATQKVKSFVSGAVSTVTDLFKKKDNAPKQTFQTYEETDRQKTQGYKVGENQYSFNDLNLGATKGVVEINKRVRDIENEIINNYTKEKGKISFAGIDTPFDVPDAFKMKRESVEQILRSTNFETADINQSAITKTLGTGSSTQRKSKELVEERKNLLAARDLYNTISNHPIQDKSFWNDIKVATEETGKDVDKLIPIYGSIKSIGEMKDLYNISKKKSQGQVLTPYELSLQEKTEAKELESIISERGLGYHLTKMVLALPTYSAEFLLTGGLASAASKTVQATPALIKIASKSPAAAKLIGSLTGITAQTTIGFSPRILEKSAEYATNDKNYSFDVENGFNMTITGTDKDFTSAITKQLPKGYAMTWIEVAGERSGEGMEYIKKGLLSKWFKKNNFKSTKEAETIFKKMGWNGVVNEVAEEELTALAQAPIEGKEYKAPILTEEGNQRLLLEVLGMGIYGGLLKTPGAVSKISGTISNTISGIQKSEVKTKEPTPKVTSIVEKPVKDSRPNHQKLLEEAANKKNIPEIKKILDSIPASDPYKKPMENLFRGMVTEKSTEVKTQDLNKALNIKNTEKVTSQTLEGKREDFRLDKQENIDRYIQKGAKLTDTVTVYRAGTTEQINGGQYVTTSEARAKDVYLPLTEGGKVLKSEVKIEDLVFGNGLKSEFVYSPKVSKTTIIPKGQKERGFVTSVKKSTNVPDTVKEKVAGTYTPKPDTQLKSEAQTILEKGKELGIEGLDELDAKVVATMQEAINLAKAGNISASEQLYNSLGESLTSVARGLRAAGLLKGISPEAVALSEARELRRIKEKALEEKTGLKPKEVKNDLIRKGKKNIKAPTLVEWSSIIAEVRC